MGTIVVVVNMCVTSTVRFVLRLANFIIVRQIVVYVCCVRAQVAA
jgi:hypothetical protein